MYHVSNMAAAEPEVLESNMAAGPLAEVSETAAVSPEVLESNMAEAEVEVVLVAPSAASNKTRVFAGDALLVRIVAQILERHLPREKETMLTSCRHRTPPEGGRVDQWGGSQSQL